MLRRLPIAFIVALLVAFFSFLFGASPWVLVSLAGLVFLFTLFVDPLNI